MIRDPRHLQQMPATTDDLRRKYLLGELDERTRAALEERLFAGDDALSVDLQAAEDDLIDDYVRGRLTRTERRRFEAALPGVPSRRRKLAFAGALARASPARRAGWGHRSMRLWCLGVAAAATLFVVAWSRLPLPLGGPTLALHPSPAAEGDSAPPTTDPPATVRVVLLAGTLRGASAAATVNLGPAIDGVELQAFVEIDGAPPPRCRARVTRVSGAEIWAGDVPLVRDADGVHARLTVPAAKLSADDYLVTLAADPTPAGELASYALRVVR
jgi:hypothetical protein